MHKNRKFLNNKVFLTIYFLINIIDFNRIYYTLAFTFAITDTMATPVGTVCFYLCVLWIISIHLALLITLVFVYFKKHKMFLIVSAIDYVVYAFCVFFIETRYSVSDDFVIRICIFILHSILFLFTFYRVWKNQKVEDGFHQFQSQFDIDSGTRAHRGRFSVLKKKEKNSLMGTKIM